MRRLKVKCGSFFLILNKERFSSSAYLLYWFGFFPQICQLQPIFHWFLILFIHFVEKHFFLLLHEPQNMPTPIILRIHLNHFYIITVKFIFNTWLRKRINDFNRFTGRAYPPAFFSNAFDVKRHHFSLYIVNVLNTHIKMKKTKQIEKPHWNVKKKYIKISHLQMNSTRCSIHWNVMIKMKYSLNLQLNGSIRPVPPPRDHLRMEKDGRMVNRAPAPQVPDRNPALHSNQIAQIVDATPEQLDSIKKYQVKIYLKIQFTQKNAVWNAECYVAVVFLRKKEMD